MGTAFEPAPRRGLPEVNIDVAGVVSQFLSELSLIDLVVELVQNELDAGSNRTEIDFGDQALVCCGRGRNIDAKGWRRLSYVLGAGGIVEAKSDGIGSKNHGLRAAFLIGDCIVVQSGGKRIDLTVRGRPERPGLFYPAVWPAVADDDAPSKGTRITIPYRTSPLDVPERNALEPVQPSLVDALFSDAGDRAVDRFVCASAPGRRWHYELVLRREGGPSRAFTFTCEPVKGQPGMFLRTCREGAPGRRPKLVARRMSTPFELNLAENDRAKVPRLFRLGARVRAELSWAVDARGKPLPTSGTLRYPIAYPTDQVRVGAGFDISGPFISGRARHSVSDDARNALILDAARSVFAELLAGRLVPLHGPSALVLLADAAQRNSAIEDDLVDRILLRGGMPIVAAGASRAPAKWAVSVVGRPIAIASPSYDAGGLSASLAGIVPPTLQALHPDSPSNAVDVMLRALSRDRSGLVRFDERQAALAVLIREAPKAGQPAPPAWTERCAATLQQLQAARTRGALQPELGRTLQASALLPTTAGTAMPWSDLSRSLRPPPCVPGVMPPAILYRSFARFGILREGATRIPEFKLDAYVSNKNFEKVTSEGRHMFFDWLRTGYRHLLPKTLVGIALYPIWPGTDGKYRPLEAYCRPRSGALRAMLREVGPEPAPELLAFPGITRTGRGNLKLRTQPTVIELHAWHAHRTSTARRLASAADQTTLRQYVSETEAGLDALRSERTWQVREAVSGHLTLSASGKLLPITALHLPSPQVDRCRLLDDDLVGGERLALYSEIGGLVRPSYGALLRAMRDSPSELVLFARLEAYEAGGGNLADLAEEPVVPVHGTPMRPGRLCFPSTTNWWGEWKTPLERTPQEPARVAALERAGVVRPALREELSRSFFLWLSAKETATQRRHVQQVVRHWSERRHGPSRWIRRHSELRCILVRGLEGVLELASLTQAETSRSRIFLPDFPELQEQMLVDEPQARLAVTEAPAVDGSILTLLKEAGVPSLRGRVGAPVRLLHEGDLSPDRQLEAELALVSSAEMARSLSRRLSHHEVPPSALRTGWRRLLRDLKGVRNVSHVLAAYRIFRREYELAVPAAVDGPTGLVCIGKAADRRLAFYDALARHLFADGTSPLYAYGLLQAVHADHPATPSSDLELFPDDDVAEGPTSATRDDEARPIPRAGHGLAGQTLNPRAPEPNPLAAIVRPTYRAEGQAPPKPTRPTSRTDSRRNSVEEDEQIRQLKEQHYAWHCQACVGRYDVLQVTPPDSYLYLPTYRRSLVEAHHVEHLQNEGGLGAANLLILCQHHHRVLGDRLSRAVVRDALAAAVTATRAFPTDADGRQTSATTGKLAIIAGDSSEGDAALFFTGEHASSWLAGT